MPIISKKDLVAKNKEGNGIRPQTPNARAVEKLADLITRAAKVIGSESIAGETVELSLNMYTEALKTMATTRITKENGAKISGALNTLDGFNGDLTYKDQALGKTHYELIAEAMPKIGSSKKELDELLTKANGILEMGLEKTVLKPLSAEDLAKKAEEERKAREAQERIRAEQERIRQEAEDRKLMAYDKDSFEDLKKLLVDDEIKAGAAEYGKVTVGEKIIKPTEIPEIRIDESHSPEIRVKVPGKEDIVIPAKTIPAQVIPARTIPGRTIPANEDPTVTEAFDELYGIERTTAENGEEFVDDPVQMAVDENGKVYEDREAILGQLNKPGSRLFVFKKDGLPPLALENRDGKLYATKEPVCAAYQLPSKDGKLYEAKPSLDPRDIAKIPSKYLVNSLKKKMEGPREKVKNAQKWIDEARTMKRESEEWLASHRKPPRLGAVRTFQRWMYKMVTLGRGETSAYERYKNRKKRWARNVERNTYRAAMADLRINTMKDAHKANKERLEELDKELTRATSAYINKDPKGQKKKIEEYRKRTEVRMEGVADMIKNGKVTQDNIFANTWLAEQSCRGKNFNDESALYVFMNYLVSRAVEEKILDDTINDPDYSRPRNEIEVERINNGHAIEMLDKDPAFHKLVRDHGSEPIDPDKLYKEYKSLVQARTLEQKDPVNKLRLHRQKLLDDFGEKPITKDCLMDVAKLNVLDDWIRIGEKTFKGLAELEKKEKELALNGEQLSDKEKDEKRQLSAKAKQFKTEAPAVISDLGVKNSDDTHVADFDPYLEPEYVNAIEKIEKNLNKSAKKIDKAFEDLPEHQKKAWLRNDRLYKLDEITDMVNRVAGKKEPEKEPEGPQPQL